MHAKESEREKLDRYTEERKRIRERERGKSIKKDVMSSLNKDITFISTLFSLPFCQESSPRGSLV